MPWGIAKIAAYDFWAMHQSPVQRLLILMIIDYCFAPSPNVLKLGNIYIINHQSPVYIYALSWNPAMASVIEAKQDIFSWPCTIFRPPQCQIPVVFNINDN